MFEKQSYPSLIKYMGSKSRILDFIIESLNSVDVKNNTILDLFAGSSSLSGAIGNQCNFISNDIQSYSSILAKTYLYTLNQCIDIKEISNNIKSIYTKNVLSELTIDYSKINSLEEFNNIENIQKNLINNDFSYEYHLFAKNYSGTWWSYEQCVWIDAIRQTADLYKNESIFSFLLSSLMYAMAYSSQGTGHYAQYRDAKTQKSMADIAIYRRKSVYNIFIKKLSELIEYGQRSLGPDKYSNDQWNLDFKDALNNFQGGTVYADPPYCFVHYSRFYHALETLVLYDYPEIQTKSGELVKGRYRKDRHQSPFSIKTQVEQAFLEMFQLIKKTDSNLILSYSNTGMISIEQLSEIASSVWNSNDIDMLTTNHQHMTLGRQGKRFRDVIECTLIMK